MNADFLCQAAIAVWLGVAFLNCRKGEPVQPGRRSPVIRRGGRPKAGTSDRLNSPGIPQILQQEPSHESG